MARLDPKKLGVGDVSNFFGNAKGDSFLSRLFGKGGVGSDIGRTLQHLLVQRGDPGSAMGASLGGSLFSTLMGGDTGKAISGGLSGLFGKTLGKGIGSFIPFGGEILGSLVGKLFGKIAGPTKYEQEARSANASISDLWKNANAQYGGNADQALSMFGFKPADLKGKNFQGAMGLEPLKDVFTELQKRQGQFNDDLGGMLGRIKSLGGNLGEALQPYLDRLRSAKVLTEDNLSLISQLAGQNTVDFAQMEEAANRYGISVSALGQAFKENKMHESWQQIIDDMDLLQRGGADMNEVLAGMTDEINTLVQQSIAFGTTIPENMRPWIQKLIDSGKLLGATGEKIEDISTLNFGETMQTTLDNLNKTLQQLIEALGVGLPNATDTAAKRWRENFDNLPMPGGGGGGRRDGFVPSDGGGPGARPTGPAHAGTVVIQMDGRTVAQGVVPFIPGVVTRAGLTR